MLPRPSGRVEVSNLSFLGRSFEVTTGRTGLAAGELREGI